MRTWTSRAMPPAVRACDISPSSRGVKHDWSPWLPSAAGIGLGSIPGQSWLSLCAPRISTNLHEENKGKIREHGFCRPQGKRFALIVLSMDRLLSAQSEWCVIDATLGLVAFASLRRALRPTLRTFEIAYGAYPE